MEKARGSTRMRKAALIAVLLACAGFAIWPVEIASVAPPVVAQPETTKAQVATLDLAAFRVPLWVADPAPPAPAVANAPAPPPPPLKIQLLAIIHEDDAYKAAVYDPDSDRILVVAAGGKVGTRKVEKIDEATLTLRDDTGKRVLALKAGGARAVGGEGP